MPDLDALIQAAGTGDRLGLGPKAFVQLRGATLLEWAVRAVRPFASQVIVAVPPDRVAAARRLVPNGVRVIAGGATRSETLRALVAEARTEWILLHDVAQPLASRADFEHVIAAAGTSGAACAATALHASVRPARAGVLGEAVAGPLWMALKPAVLPAPALITGPNSGEPVGAMDLLRAAGVGVVAVATSRRNFKVTDQADLELAELLCDQWPGWD